MAAPRPPDAVDAILAQWQRELLLAMTLAGVTRVADIGPQHLDTD